MEELSAAGVGATPEAGAALNSTPPPVSGGPASSSSDLSGNAVGQSPGESLDTSSSESPGEIFDHHQLAEHARGLTKEEKAALHTELVKDPDYNSVYQADRDAHAKRFAQTAVEQLRAEGEHRDQMLESQRRLGLLSAEERDAAMWNDQEAARQAQRLGLVPMDARKFRTFVNDVADFRDQSRQVPVIQKLKYEAAEEMHQNIKGFLGARPDWKEVVESNWAKLEADAIAEHGATPEAYAAVQASLLDARWKRELPGRERALRSEIEAKVHDKVAEYVEGLPEPELVTAGRANGRSFGSLDEARAAHVKEEIDNDAMRRIKVRFGE